MSGITSIKSLIKPLGYSNGGEVKNQGTKILAEQLIKPTDIDPLYDETGGSRLDAGKTKFSGGLPTPPIVDKIARGIFNALNPFKKAKLAMNIASNKPFSTNLMSSDDFFDYGYRVKPSDTPPKDPLGDLKPKDDKVEVKKDITKDEVKTVKDEVENVTRDDRFGLFKRQQLAAPKSEIERLFQKPQIKKIFKESKNQLIRGHALEPSAASVIPEVKGVKDFSIYEVIPKKLLENVVLTRASDVRRPLFFTTEKGNRIHEKLGASLIKDLVEKYRVQGYVFKPNKKTKGGEWVFDEKIIPENQVEKIKELNKSISLKEKKLTDLKLQTMFYDPAKDRLVYFGSSPTSLADLRKTMIERGFNKGGMASIEEIIQEPIRSKYISW